MNIIVEMVSMIEIPIICGNSEKQCLNIDFLKLILEVFSSDLDLTFFYQQSGLSEIQCSFSLAMCLFLSTSYNPVCSLLSFCLSSY